MQIQTTKPVSRFQQLLCALLLCLTMVSIQGCAEPPGDNAEKPKTGIIGKKTQEIGEFNPNGDAKAADLQVKETASPIGAALGSYGFAVSEISKMAVQRALQLFEATNERYPKDHEEFMTEIIKKNNIQLPVLPGGRQYQYDVKNHELVVVEAEKNSGK